MAHLRYNVSVVTGNCTGISATAVTGASVFIGGMSKRVIDLSAFCDVTASTASLTYTPSWQVSNDNTNWVTCSLNPVIGAAAAIATGAGSHKQVAVEAPAAAFGYKFARCLLTIGGATGTTNDVYSIGYSYRHLDAGSPLGG